MEGRELLTRQSQGTFNPEEAPIEVLIIAAAREVAKKAPSAWCHPPV